MSNQKYDEKYFFNEYHKENPNPCIRGDCENINGCVMGFLKKNSKRGLEENPNRIEIFRGLAQLTVKMNKKLEKLFRNIQKNSGVKTPINPPIYRLKLHFCSDHKISPIISSYD